MKKYILLLLVAALLPLRAYSQTLHTESYKSTPEWHTYKVLRACGWTSLGVGVTAMGAGVFLGLAIASIEGGKKAWPGAVVFSSGAVLTAASIPLLVTAYRYRSKAQKSYISIGATRLTAPDLSPTYASTPALSLSITF